jgi:hypothetical protein
MRPMKFVVLSSLSLTALLMLTISSQAQTTDDQNSGLRGTAPRMSADRYHSHAQLDGVSVGAEILTSKQVGQSFASDLNRCCIVVEFAFYPKKGEPLVLSLDDFALFISGGEMATKPESAAVVAAQLQKDAGSGLPVLVHASAAAGYESQSSKAHVYTAAQVGVDVNNSNSLPRLIDPAIMEEELSKKGLPEGQAAVPVSGYLYFSIPKRDKNAKYQLEYNLNGEKLILPLP